MIDKLKASASKYAFTLFFVAWEVGKRLRGKWRRSALRDWLTGRTR